eukprot:TRINITY_DN87129_c0_g1_i1.p1 TRINITY_DN87129_c0_g1~~TRINITY_DN87129_c0_g1_i1.p1  ORF type:complete len:200 (-),score=57.71 TRINITY_DN87129_c0_g1_i1:56-655(-)
MAGWHDGGAGFSYGNGCGMYAGQGGCNGGYGMPWPGDQGMTGMDMGKGDFRGKGSFKGDATGGKGMCKFFLQGTCTRGASCAFSHDTGGKSCGGKDAGGKGTWNGGAGELDEDELEDEMLADFEKFRTEGNAAQADDGASSDGDPLPPPASEAEVEEARRIVQQATREAEDRKKMQAKVSQGCSQNDLQAMINARLAKK